MSTSKHDKDTKDNSIKQSNVDTAKIINQTFDDAKNKVCIAGIGDCEDPLVLVLTYHIDLDFMY
jgi:hypothetical protein